MSSSVDTVIKERKEEKRDKTKITIVLDVTSKSGDTEKKKGGDNQKYE